jgi:sirohydrochlorin ferrochelatase
VTTAILLIAHGSRRAAANDDLKRIAEQIASRRPDAVVEIAYLELAEPSISQGAAACVTRGANEVRMLPFFLSPGSHVVDDLERFRSGFESQYPGVAFILCPPLGLHPLLVDVLLERAEQRLES